MCEVFKCVTTHIVFQFRFSLRCLAQLVAIGWLGDDCSVGEGPPSYQHLALRDLSEFNSCATSGGLQSPSCRPPQW